MQLPQLCWHPKKTWHCYNCSKNLLSFPSINKFKLSTLLSDKNYCKSFSNESLLALKSPKNLAYLFDEFNSFLSDIGISPENIIISKYYDMTLINCQPLKI